MNEYFKVAVPILIASLMSHFMADIYGIPMLHFAGWLGTGLLLLLAIHYSYLIIKDSKTNSYN